MTDMPELVGGALCLDFVNTVDPRHAANRFDYLSEYRALVAWARHAGAIEAPSARVSARPGQRQLRLASHPPNKAGTAGGGQQPPLGYAPQAPPPLHADSREGLGLPLHIRSAGAASVVQNLGGILNQPGVLLC